MNIAGTLNYDTKVDTDGIEQGVDKVSKTAKSGGDIVKIAVGNMIADLARVAVDGLKQITSAGINYNAQMETYQTSFKVMLGSAEEANDFLAQLKDKASKTPFELVDLAKASQTLLAFGVNANDTQKYLDILGDVSQGNAEKLDSLSLAFGQVQSAGKLSGQDLLQFINVGMNPLNEIAKKTGESMVDLKERMSNGGVSAQEVADAFESATSEGGLFYGSMEEQSKTFNGQMSTLKDNVSTFLGKAFKPLFDFAKDTALPVLNDLTTGGKATKKWLNENKNLIIIVAGVLGTLVTAIIAYNIALNIATITTTIATVATTAFGAVLAFITSPITLVVLAIGALITIGVLLYKNWDTIKEFAIKIWNSIVDFFIGIGESIGNIINGMIEFWKKLPEYIGLMVGYIIGFFVNFYEFMWNFYTVTIPNIIMGIINWFKELPKNILNFFSNIISGIASWVVNMINTVTTEVPKIINKIVDFFAQLPGKMIDIGKNIVRGIWDGINSMVDWVGDKIKGFAGGITKGFKKALGIASPSKVFKKEAKWIPVGVGIGIEENTDEAIKGIDKLSDSMVNRMQQAVSLEAGKVSFSGTGGTVSQMLSSNATFDGNFVVQAKVQEGVLFEANERITAVKNLQTQFS